MLRTLAQANGLGLREQAQGERGKEREERRRTRGRVLGFTEHPSPTGLDAEAIPGQVTTETK